MRRLAKQDRDDEYASRKDYQTVHEKIARRATTDTPGPHKLVLEDDFTEQDESVLYGCGGYVRADKAGSLEVTFTADGASVVREVPVDTAWRRFGIGMEAAGSTKASLSLEWSGPLEVDLWGLAVGPAALPEPAQEASTEELNQDHLAPESFYLDHSAALGMDVAEESLGEIQLGEGSSIGLKKCSYCGRLLPLDMSNFGSLAFHKHNAKATNHQNECRACKKWRINDTFNPLRTQDQLHESSVITRERKLFLREPAILQAIKDREGGSGLRTYVWELFDRKCFYCGMVVTLKGFQLDHTRPLAYLWPIDEHATCLCAGHNNQKKEKFPVDFYAESQLRDLAKILGLSYEELTVRDVKEVELNRIVEDIAKFAREWDPRTFAATARKVMEMRPTVDLFAILGEADPDALEELREQLRDRPDPVE